MNAKTFLAVFLLFVSGIAFADTSKRRSAHFLGEDIRGNYHECFEEGIDDSIACVMDRNEEVNTLITLMEILSETRRETDELDAWIRQRGDQALIDRVQQADDPIEHLHYELRIRRESMLRYEAEEIIRLMKERGLVIQRR